ncbi:hypothetical protein BGZ82_009102 [Podila clonocystis]|nr:hypothetical protein BGZ82_009102 [Podila clonocystis]
MTIFTNTCKVAQTLYTEIFWPSSAERVRSSGFRLQTRWKGDQAVRCAAGAAGLAHILFDTIASSGVSIAPKSTASKEQKKKRDWGEYYILFDT